MRNITKLALLLFAMTYSLFSQDRDPSPYKFTYQFEGKLYRDTCLSPEVFKQKKFVLGAQWGMHPRMGRALHMNVNEGWPPTLSYGNDGGLPRNPYTDYPMYHIWQNVEFWTDPNLPETQNKYHPIGIGFVFEPTLYIPHEKRGQFITKPNDTTRAIWGFSDIRATIPSSTADPDFDRLKITTSVPIGTVVLNNAWPKDLYYFNDSGTEEDKTKRNGRQWIVSVNLRYLDTSFASTSSNAAITIKMPYRLRRSKTVWDPPQYIKFSALPSGDILDTMHYGYFEDLGKGYNWTNAPTRPTEFNIPFKLIPDTNRRKNNGMNRDITVNAVFICDDQILLNNPLLKSAPEHYGRIDSLDIEVTYHGGADIGINWIRVCTPYTYEHYTGKYDSASYYWAKRCIDTIRYYGYNNYYVYTMDEHGPQYFSGLGRYSKQYNGCIVAEGSGGLHHKYGENVAHVWWGGSNPSIGTDVPYIFAASFDGRKKENVYRLGHPTKPLTGSTFINQDNIETDLNCNSCWESWRDTTKWTDNNITASASYFDRIQNDPAFQPRLEWANISSYYNSESVIYEDTPWWSNSLPSGQWGGAKRTYVVRWDTTIVRKVDSLGRVYYDTTITTVYDKMQYPGIGWNRPEFGEESRWLIWNRLIFGAKGLMYDAHCQSFLNDSSNTLSLGFLDVRPEYISCFDTASTETLLYKEDPVFGVDFIPPVDSATKVTNNFNRDSTGKYLGTGPDRIYYGRKSPKLEMLKAHTYIRAVDSLLMDMRLVATFSKGIRIWESADTAHGYPSTILDSILSLNRAAIIYDPFGHLPMEANDCIKTRPLNRMRTFPPFSPMPHYEPYDSTFVDVTLHRFSEDPELKKVFVLGVQNRRIDPLIYFQDSTNMSYWSTAELEDSCRHSSNPALWKQRYWQRLGTREISIPFNYTKIVRHDKAGIRI